MTKIGMEEGWGRHTRTRRGSQTSWKITRKKIITTKKGIKRTRKGALFKKDH
jgi:hypothetical protein